MSRYVVEKYGQSWSVSTVPEGYESGNWTALFKNRCDAEAWVASKRECVPLPEPTKHRCRRKSDGAEFSFCVMPCTDIAFIFLSNWERWSEKDFRAAFDILPECE